MTRPVKRTSTIFKKIQSQRDPAEFKRLKGKMWLASKIAEGIRNKGWNKTQFADAIQQTPSTVSRWLSGQHNFTVDTLNDIEDILGIDLLNWENQKYEVATRVNGIIDSNMAINVFITDNDYSKASNDGSIIVEISSNTAFQVVKKCDSGLN
jgi:transcriptional regulator with XRE-family HTH domain